MRKTKIVCTLGPATDSPEMLAALIAAGANIFRLNMSHGAHDWVRAVVPRIREAGRQGKANIAIMMDTQGPAIRTGDLATSLDLKPGDTVEFTVRGARSEEEYSVDVNYDGLIDDISVGDVVMVDNGNIHMKVLGKRDNRIRCEVLTQGVLGSRRHINLPGVKVNLPPLTEKDLKDMAVGAETGVDYFALSFCREKSDVEAMRAEIKRLGSTAKIIAKIEDQHAVKFVKEIIAAADAVMVARGDLGIECPMEELPIIQRRIVKSCIRVGKPVIVATHMLESMITNPLPTRAEITDVANAVYEQADGIMLSGETPGPMRGNFRSCGPTHRTQWRCGIRPRGAGRRSEAKDGRGRGQSGQQFSQLENRRFHPARQHGALRRALAPGTRGHPCVFPP
ncbi:MAG: pyruvate kinase [Chthoniobacterales bacterium]